jgi:NADH:ubiquinone oxidoreductase subunit 4 (subunit M)
MTAPSLIFWTIFVLPMVAFLIWLMRQDKRKGWIGLVVLAITVIGAIVYTVIKNDGKQDPVTTQMQHPAK